MPLKMTSNQQVAAAIAYVDSDGNPAAVDGAPVWAAGNPSILTIEAAEDGLSAVIKAAGPIGTSQVSITADVRMGPEIKPLVTMDEIEIIAAEAVAGTVTFGAPEDQP